MTEFKKPSRLHNYFIAPLYTPSSWYCYTNNLPGLPFTLSFSFYSYFHLFFTLSSSSFLWRRFFLATPSPYVSSLSCLPSRLISLKAPSFWFRSARRYLGPIVWTTPRERGVTQLSWRLLSLVQSHVLGPVSNPPRGKLNSLKWSFTDILLEGATSHSFH